MKRIFLTGATGYLGSKIALKAASEGYLINALVRDPSSLRAPEHKNIQLFKGDLNDIHSILYAMDNCEIVIHSAALAKLHSKDPDEIYRINVEGTKNVLKAAHMLQVEKFLFTSSCAVMGNSLNLPLSENDPRITPLENDYEISKYWAEELVKEYFLEGLKTVILSPPILFGPGINSNGNSLSSILKNALSRGFAFYPSGNTYGNFAFVDDVVDGHINAIKYGKPGEKYILGGENISYETFFQSISTCSGKKVRLIPVTKPILNVFSRINLVISTILNRNTNMTPIAVRRIFANRLLSCQKAILELQYRITPFEKAFTQTLQNLKS
ncbi:MAG: NAD-dependent epimerase/dehydratase family protein [Flavitalea sp.]